MCLASNLVKEAAAHADSAAAADKALREIDHEKTTFTRREIESKRHDLVIIEDRVYDCLLYTSPSPRDKRQSRMPSSA